LVARGKGRDGGVSWRSSLLFVLGAFSGGAALAAEPATAPASKDAMPAVKASAAPVTKSNADPAANSKAEPARRAGTDRLNLDTTTVTGNKELPKVLYIVPWKRADLGDLSPQPMNSLLDEALTPVDRDVFRREVTYYGAMTGTDAAAKGPAGPSAAGSEK